MLFAIETITANAMRVFPRLSGYDRCHLSSGHQLRRDAQHSALCGVYFNIINNILYFNESTTSVLRKVHKHKRRDNA